jgi:threonine 3-dehydrogenase
MPGTNMQAAGIPSKPLEPDLANDIIFKGAIVQGINGWRVFDTWPKMQTRLKSEKFDLSPLITDRIPTSDFAEGMELLMSGNASKVLHYPNGKP